jgi:hypothetical protein
MSDLINLLNLQAVQSAIAAPIIVADDVPAGCIN